MEKKRMKLNKLIPVVAALGLAVSGAFGAAGTFGSFVQIDGTWFQTVNPGAIQITDFDTADLGDFALSSTHEITGASLLIFKNSGSDVTGAEIQWRVYSGAPAGAFTTVGIGFGGEDPTTDPAGNTYPEDFSNNQNWQSTGFTQDFTSSLLAGDYTLEVFYRGTTAADGPIFSNNGGNNFTATFTVVPEPATMALFGMGLAGLFVARRRRA